MPPLRAAHVRRRRPRLVTKPDRGRGPAHL